MRYFPHSDNVIKAMLKSIGKNSLDELFSSIPNDLILKETLELPPAKNEQALKRELIPLSSELDYVNFLGAGATKHFVPEWISQQLLRAEWYTSYTPYQPEAAQGTLQAIFEFQSMVASLFGMEVANASMYDGATALAEAILLAFRVTHKKTVLISETVHKEYRDTVKTYLSLSGYQVIEIAMNQGGLTDVDDTSQKITRHKNDVAAVVIQSPNFFSSIEDVRFFADAAHSANALSICVMTDICAGALLNSFGSMGADIAVGDGLGFLPSLSLGGPGVGLFACKRSLLRQMPGRLVGQTVDANNQPGYVLTLSTREQHIRREKATSNICTNHNLMALALSMTLASYGKTGFVRLAKTNLKKTLYFRSLLSQFNVPVSFTCSHFNETVVNLYDSLDHRYKKALENKIIPGLLLEHFYPSLKGQMLVSTTELHEDEDIFKLASVLAGVNDA